MPDIKPGPWKMRCGKKAIVAASNENALPSFYWIGWRTSEGFNNDDVYGWNKYGKDGYVTDNKSAFDLIESWKEKTVIELLAYNNMSIEIPSSFKNKKIRMTIEEI